MRKNSWLLINIAVSFQNEPESAREAFDAFLARYPYCYGYWKKYADLETKNDNMDEAEKVRCLAPEEFDLDLVECVSYHLTMLHWGTLTVPIKYLTMSFVLFTTGSREKACTIYCSWLSINIIVIFHCVLTFIYDRFHMNFLSPYIN